MSRISTYEVVPVPKLADKLIGTSVGGEIEDVTYNFTLQELLNLFIPFIPANNLQGVLDFGNTATQDINLFGTITTTNLDVTNTSNLFITYLNDEVHIVGSLFDSNDFVGTAGQVLISTGAGVEWYSLPPIFTPNLQQVLTEGNTSTVDIILTSNLSALDVSSDTATFSTDITIDGTLTDGAASVGTLGKVLSSTVTGVQWVDLPSYSAISPLFFNSATGVFSIQVANNLQNGYLSSADWINFDGKQPAGNYITALTGEATASGPGSVPITLNNASVIAKVLTGLNVTGGSISATDSILIAFGKVQNQINGLLGGVQYQGVWNAFTNNPVLTSSVGTQGYYYVVNVAGSTNLNGITDWQVGDWAIFSGGVWQKVDNTDAVSSVNGQVGAVSLTTDNIPEGVTNLYFLNSRARTAVSATSPLLYDNSTGVFSIQVANSSQSGYLSSADWIAFDGKQNLLGGTGLVKSTAGTISYITDNSTNWNTAYNDSIVSAAVTGTGTKTLTLTQQDAGTITASWTDLGLTSVALSMPSAFNVANSPLTANGTLAVTAIGLASQYIRGDGTLANFPTDGGGGGSSVSYYLNGSVNQGTFGGNTYYEMSKTPIFGAGTDFNIAANGYIAQFLTDANDPNALLIPAGNWNFETYFSASSGGGSPTFYIELYKFDGVVFTLIASNSATPELISLGTNINPYFSALAVPETVLTATDRLAIRIYVNHSGRTITLHTENSHLCQVITTFTTGIQALNGLTKQTQYFAVGTSGTDFNISSATDTHTFNIPSASASNRGLITTGSQTIAGEKTFTAIRTNINGALVIKSGVATGVSIESFTANYLSLGVTNGVSTYTQDLIFPASSANVYTFPSASGTIALVGGAGVGTVTSVAALTLGTTGTDLSSTVANGTTTPVITLNVPTASATNRGALSSADWTSFNGKQDALSGTGIVKSTAGVISYLTDPLPIANGGTGSSTQNFVDLTTDQTIAGFKTFSYTIKLTNGTSNAFSFESGTTGFYASLKAPAGLGAGIIVTLPSATGTLALTSDIPANPVGGTGTTNNLPKFTGASTIGDSAITDDGTTVTLVSRALSGTSATFSSTATASAFIPSGASVPTNGMYLSAANTLNFATNSTNRLSITSGGDVLVGNATSSGSGLLSIAVGNSVGGAIKVHDTDGGGTIEMQASGGATYLFATTNHPLLIGTNNTERMRITSGGNVGIGTSSPSVRLQVLGGTITTNTQSTYAFGVGNSSGYDLTFGTDASFAYIQSWASKPLQINNQGNNLILNATAGNVLIGTTSDNGAKFQVSGAATFSGRINGVVGGTAFNTAGLWLQGSSSTDGIAIGGTGSADKTIDTYGGTLKINATSGNGLSVTGTATFSSGVGINGATLQTGLGAGLTIEGGSYAPLYLSNSGTLRGFLAAYSGGILLSASTGILSLNNAGGNVLIGTTTDAGYKLDVNAGGGSVRFNGTIGDKLVLYNSGNNGGTNGIYIDSDIYPAIRFNNRVGYAGTAKIVYNTYATGYGAASLNGSFIMQGPNALQFSSGGDNVRMTIDASGNIGAPTGTNIYNASDLRLKRNITTITDGLDKILNLNPVKFNWIENYVSSEENKDMFGFIAQEIQKIIPEAVESFADGNLITVGNTIIDNPLRVNEKFIIPILVKAIQELSAKITQLENK
jgi:hypothetical protein